MVQNFHFLAHFGPFMSRKSVVIEPQPSIYIKKMKEKIRKARIKLLQKVADFICERAKYAKTEKEFDFWIWQGLSLDYNCVEKGIYLN